MSRFDDIRQWANDRCLIDGSTPEKQFLKLAEETGEIAQGIAKDRPVEVYDGIGDVVVVLTILAAQCGMDIEDCIEHAWNEIKDRKGKMIDGIFVKETDLKDYTMDYSESMIEAKRLLHAAEDAAMKRDYDTAYKCLNQMDTQLKRMLNWFWKEMEDNAE